METEPFAGDPSGPVRPDHRIIFEMIDPESKVLDLGCGNGDLGSLLVERKNVRFQGIELDEDAIYRCVGKGLSVFHGDIESGLAEYPGGSFDFVIMNQTLQEVRKVDFAIREGLRVGRKLVIGFPNFACLPCRVMLFFRGKAPVTVSLPHRWFDTPNVRFLSIGDMRDFCAAGGIRVLGARYLDGRKEIRLWPNLRAQNAVFVLAAEEKNTR
jgi:methionine biosynthesis protein MetW